MRFKVDENLHDEVAALLNAAGHDARTVRDQGMRGCSDSTLADHCRADDRVVVTLDLDFANIRAFPPHAGAGTIVLRVGNQSRRHVLQVIQRVLDLLNDQPTAGRLWIVTEGGTRIRGGT